MQHGIDGISALIGQAAGGGATGGSFGMIGMMVLMFAIMYFVLIRPQQKRMKEHQNLLAALTTGDTVITRGGIIGKITGIQDNVVTLELQEKVRVRVLKSYIEGKHSTATATATAPSKDKAKAQPAAE